MHDHLFYRRSDLCISATCLVQTVPLQGHAHGVACMLRRGGDIAAWLTQQRVRVLLFGCAFRSLRHSAASYDQHEEAQANVSGACSDAQEHYAQAIQAAAASSTPSPSSPHWLASPLDPGFACPPPPQVADVFSWGAATLDGVHSLTGLPWWASIPLTSLTLKVALLPLSLRNAKIIRTNLVLWSESAELTKQRMAKLNMQAAADTHKTIAYNDGDASTEPLVNTTEGSRAGLGTNPSASGSRGSGGPGASTLADSLAQLASYQARVRVFHDLRRRCDVPHPAWALVNMGVQVRDAEGPRTGCGWEQPLCQSMRAHARWPLRASTLVTCISHCDLLHEAPVTELSSIRTNHFLTLRGLNVGVP